MSKKVFIGVGHGGTDSGAVGHLVEKEVNLVEALACKDFLEMHGVEVLMSRAVDENELLPEYLMLWFSRPEFDRYARFKSHGSVREIMDWDEMCKVELPVPSIDKQRSIVKAYQTITERIELKRRINDNLAA